jgi:hypothetical protein
VVALCTVRSLRPAGSWLVYNAGYQLTNGIFRVGSLSLFVSNRCARTFPVLKHCLLVRSQGNGYTGVAVRFVGKSRDLVISVADSFLWLMLLLQIPTTTTSLR